MASRGDDVVPALQAPWHFPTGAPWAVAPLYCASFAGNGGAVAKIQKKVQQAAWGGAGVSHYQQLRL